MSFPGDSRHIPNFLRATKAKNLRRLMFQKQIKDGKEYHFFDFSYVADESKWYVWFMERVEIDLETGEERGAE